MKLIELELPPGSMVCLSGRTIHAVAVKPLESPEEYRLNVHYLFKEAGHRINSLNLSRLNGYTMQVPLVKCFFNARLTPKGVGSYDSKKKPLLFLY